MSFRDRTAAERFLYSLGERVRAAACHLAGVCLVASVAGAATTEWTPRIAVKGEYEDNVAFRRGDREQDFNLTVQPEITAAYRTERLDLRPSGHVNVRRYAELSSLNDERYFLGLSAEYAATESFTLLGGVRYRKDTTLDSELEETGVVSRREDRFRFEGDGGLRYHLSERSEVGADYTYARIAYATGASVDYTHQTGSLPYRYLLSRRGDFLLLQPFYGRYESDAADVDNYGLSAGYEGKPSETLGYRVVFGARHSRVEQQTGNRETDRNWGLVVDLSLDLQGETRSVSGGYRRDLTYTSNGDPIDRDHLYLRTDSRLTERLGIRLAADVYRVEAETTTADEDSIYFTVDPSLYYRITPNQYLHAAYSYSYERDKALASDQVARRNRVWLMWTAKLRS